MSTLRVQLLSHEATAPARQTPGAAGYDLHSAERATVPAGGWTAVDTGIAIGLPDGTYGRIAPRSGLAVKHGIAVNAGVVDRDYTGPVKVCIVNHGSKPYTVHTGDRIAQLIVERIAEPDVEVVERLEATERGQAGFGSTGDK